MVSSVGQYSVLINRFTIPFLPGDDSRECVCLIISFYIHHIIVVEREELHSLEVCFKIIIAC